MAHIMPGVWRDNSGNHISQLEVSDIIRDYKSFNNKNFKYSAFALGNTKPQNFCLIQIDFISFSYERLFLNSIFCDWKLTFPNDLFLMQVEILANIF